MQIHLLVREAPPADGGDWREKGILDHFMTLDRFHPSKQALRTNLE